MSAAYLAAITARRSIYAIANKSSVPDSKIEEIVKHCVKHCPTSFNIQSSRVVVLLGEEHTKLWKFISEISLKGLEGDHKARVESRMSGHAAGYGSVLFFEDQAVIDEITVKFPIYTKEFPVWSTNATGMLQHAVWTSLSLEGLGASLQHYGAKPEIAAAIQTTFGLPSTWTSTAIMPFGDIVSPPAEKVFGPVEPRVKVLKA
ncbi:Nitroreductase family protein [Mycena sanguinolenta]|uniref:Nitroreductase family protein n=1 Tax=Mycena sanguinolenta TaxID=230812 RepID=A0A8H7CS58_9AGAR|nr:Nitroreductase family protein [Mycena sanguinolenta]